MVQHTHVLYTNASFAFSKAFPELKRAMSKYGTYTERRKNVLQRLHQVEQIVKQPNSMTNAIRTGNDHGIGINAV